VTIRRMFSNDPPRVMFTKDFRQLVQGDLLPGRQVTIVYDAERLPRERSYVNGTAAWTIRCFYKFAEQGPVRWIDLWSETGVILTKNTDEPGEGTMMTGRIDLPADADHLTLWFLNTGASAAEYWDSNFGRNYVLRFVVDDVEIAFVGVEHEANAPASRFRIDVLALPEVEDLIVLHRIMNDPAAPKDQDTRLPLDRQGPLTAAGKQRWSGATVVPVGAVVRFTLAYTAYGNPQTDSNNRRGYLTWAGSKPNREAGVL
jgi:hypothetical protein